MTAPVAPPEAAADYYSRGQRITAAALLALRDRMRLFRASDIDGSWKRLLPELVAILAATQQAEAQSAASYVPLVLAELGMDAPAAADAQPAAIVGAYPMTQGSASLLSLDQMFGFVPFEAKAWSGTGLGDAEIETRAGSLLEGIFQTQLADASRAATSVGIAARPSISGYVRMVSADACGRCLVLAGRFYRYNADFLRHPRCRCYGVPATRESARSMTFSPEEAFRGMSVAQQDRSFGKANAQAIRDGADIARVVNATGRRSGMTSTVRGVKVTREAASNGRLRLTPEAVYRLASDREDAIRLLGKYGYLNVVDPAVVRAANEAAATARANYATSRAARGLPPL